MSVNIVKVCYNCKQYCPVYPDNPKNLESVKIFENEHSGHAIQTVQIKELTNEYTLYRVKR